MLSNVPRELKERKQWINWKMVHRGGKEIKEPYQPNGQLAKTDDPSTWSSFDKCLAVIDRYSGLGYVFSAEDPYTGVDFDSCWDPATGKLSSWARPWVLKLKSYSEISPSGYGVKIWIRAKFPRKTGKNVKLKDQPQLNGKCAGVEAYDHGRYFAVTGLMLPYLSEKPEPRQDEIDELCDEFFKADDEPRTGTVDRSSRASAIERARRYIDRIPGAVSGNAGHNQTWKAACSLVLGFNLGQSEAFVLLAEWNGRCDPRWSDKELRHKIESADKQPGERGYLLKKNESEWDSFSPPEYNEPPPVASIVVLPQPPKPAERAFTEKEGLYKLEIPEFGITIEIDRLRRQSHELIGELAVRCNLAGARTFGGVLSVADFNLSSARARAERAKILSIRANAEELDWNGFVEEFCQRVLIAERTGQSSVDLREIERPQADDHLKVEGIILPRRHPTILFGDGGAAKSYTALYLAGSMAQDGITVALFDWELAGEDHRERLQRLFGIGMPKISYARCERALVYETDRLRRIVRE